MADAAAVSRRDMDAAAAAGAAAAPPPPAARESQQHVSVSISGSDAVAFDVDARAFRNKQQQQQQQQQQQAHAHAASRHHRGGGGGPQQQPHDGRARRRCSRLAIRRARRPALLVLGVTTLLTAGSLLVAKYRHELLLAAEWIRGQAPWSAVYYSLIILVWILLCLPSSLVEMVAGMIYAYPTALASVVVGKQLACNLAFVLGRRFLATSVLLRGEGLLLARLGEEEEEEAKAEGEGEGKGSGWGEGETPGESSEESSEEGPGSSSVMEEAGVEMVRAGEGEGGDAAATASGGVSGGGATMQALFLAVEAHPWQIVVLLRLLPVPIGAKNYGMAALPIPLYIYAIGTFFAEIPGTVLSTYLGASCRSLLEAINGGPHHDKRRTRQELGLLVVGLCVLLLLVVLLGRYTRHYRAKLMAEAEAQHRQLQSLVAPPLRRGGAVATSSAGAGAPASPGVV